MLFLDIFPSSLCIFFSFILEMYVGYVVSNNLMLCVLSCSNMMRMYIVIGHLYVSGTLEELLVYYFGYCVMAISICVLDAF